MQAINSTEGLPESHAYSKRLLICQADKAFEFGGGGGAGVAYSRKIAVLIVEVQVCFRCNESRYSWYE